MGEIDREEIKRMRRSYGESGLSEADLAKDPIEQFQRWLADAAQTPAIVEPNAMVLSTQSGNATRSRSVLLKDVTADGFTFFTNYNSAKSRQIEINPEVSLLFPWYPMERQVIVIGSAERVSASESDEYFASRPWSSQIGAWASAQSEPLESREELEKLWQQMAAKYPEGSQVPRPPHWGGYRVVPTEIEFWQGRYSRLHDRIRYTRTVSNWNVARFFP